MRFRLAIYTVLSLLLTIPGVSSQPELVIFLRNFLFIFFSLFIFRWLDDAWSFYIDRISHTDRFYIMPGYLKSFAITGLLLTLIWLAVLGIFSIRLFLVMFLFWLASSLLYIAFFRNRIIMTIIPLLKYPVLIWCISDFIISETVLAAGLVAFFVLLSVDLLQSIKSGKQSVQSGHENPANYVFEKVCCYSCGADDFTYFLTGEDDLTGKEGRFRYVKCNNCGLVYQNPRLNIKQIKSFYDNEYIAHRKKTNWGILTPVYEWAMTRHDREKEKITGKYTNLDSQYEVLDVGCAVGTFLLYLKQKHNCNISGVDFKEDLNYPGFEKISFYQGLFYEQDFGGKRFDLVTMWHFLEHCYDPNRSLQMASRVISRNGRLIIEVPRLDSFSFRLFGSRWPGVQAPQHTALYDKKSFIRMIEKNGFRVVKYLPYGAFPAYFYLFTGTYFKIFGKGLNPGAAIFPYFLGQLLLSPVLLFEKYLNLSMQLAVCEKIKDDNHG